MSLRKKKKKSNKDLTQDLALHLSYCLQKPHKKCSQWQGGEAQDKHVTQHGEASTKTENNHTDTDTRHRGTHEAGQETELQKITIT